MSSRISQKHPATFQCSLCPKCFTRAFNLRSHLRNHTDERPFACMVCGKAFARQNDRKSHEALHSGEKPFVCRGALGNGHRWGCGRSFARASSLGRHFRSEKGRTCIKPLAEEEADNRSASNISSEATTEAISIEKQSTHSAIYNFLRNPIPALYILAPLLRGPGRVVALEKIQEDAPNIADLMALIKTIMEEKGMMITTYQMFLGSLYAN
jgi:uncharacterized Zn-finger protein